jgi:general secretion pathway protein G
VIRALTPETRRCAGFTLLELLLVLALAALLSGLVVPRVWQWVESARTRAALGACHAALEDLPRRAFFDARRLTLGTAPALLPLPDGWQLQTAAPVTYESNGMASGGRLRLRAGREIVADWVVEPVSGTVRPATAEDGGFAAPPP